MCGNSIDLYDDQIDDFEFDMTEDFFILRYKERYSDLRILKDVT